MKYEIGLSLFALFKYKTGKEWALLSNCWYVRVREKVFAFVRVLQREKEIERLETCKKCLKARNPNEKGSI